MEATPFSYLGWFILGVSTGLGPCFAHNTLLLVPYVGMARDTARGAIVEVLIYSLARVTTYALIGGVAAAAGGFFHDVLSDGTMHLALPVLLGSLLIIIALVTLFREDSGLCHRLHTSLIRPPGLTIFFAGIFTALMPCPILLAVISVSTASGNPVHGALTASAFGLGTALAPPLLVGPLLGLLKSRASAHRIRHVVSFAGAIFLFGYGLHLIVRSLW